MNSTAGHPYINQSKEEGKSVCNEVEYKNKWKKRSKKRAKNGLKIGFKKSIKWVKNKPKKHNKNKVNKADFSINFRGKNRCFFSLKRG